MLQKMYSLYIVCVIYLLIELRAVRCVEMSKAFAIPSADECKRFRSQLCGTQLKVIFKQIKKW